jgi:hypothetical protein
LNKEKDLFESPTWKHRKEIIEPEPFGYETDDNLDDHLK